MAARIVAAIALSWIVHRAAVQSITLDEALTFLFWVHPSAPTYWEPHSNNHILNSMLMRLSIWLVGLGHISTRAPALLGGAIYILVTYRLTRRLAANSILQPVLLACFVFNPFVMDYMVAARGYGLALGFLALTLDTLASTLESPQPPIRTAVALSCFAALGLASNFSWAYAQASLFVAGLAALAWTRRPPPLRFIAASILPGLTIIILVCGPALWNFPRHQLFWGSNSIEDSLVELQRSSFDRLNPELVHPLLVELIEPLRRNADWAVLFLLLLTIPALAFKSRESNWRSMFTIAVAACLGLAALCHWLQFHFFQIPLPYERTALFSIPILTAIVGAATASLQERALRLAATGLLALFAIYFAGAIRDTHFKEWASCADIRTAFPVIEGECRRTGSRLVISDLNYTPSLNFYRILKKSTAMDEFPNYDKPSETGEVYVLPADLQKDFIERHRLRQVFKGTLSDFSVFVRDKDQPAPEPAK